MRDTHLYVCIQSLEILGKGKQGYDLYKNCFCGKNIFQGPSRHSLNEINAASLSLP